jgi:hypothetical protein
MTKKIDDNMTVVGESKKARKSKVSRRKFLTGTGVAAGAAAATMAFPNVSRAQTVTFKMQGAWGSADIFNEMALEYVKRVNDMTGGRLKIEYLNSGAVVKAFQVQDAVHKGVLDAGHLVTAYWYGKNKAASLFGTGPVFGANAAEILAWIHKGGGKELYRELVQDILKRNLVGFFCMPMPTQPLGWFKKEIKSADDLQQPVRRPRRLQGLHDGQLSSGRRVLRDHLQQGQVRFAAGRASGDPRVLGRGGQHRELRDRHGQLFQGSSVPDQ